MLQLPILHSKYVLLEVCPMLFSVHSILLSFLYSIPDVNTGNGINVNTGEVGIGNSSKCGTGTIEDGTLGCKIAVLMFRKPTSDNKLKNDFQYTNNNNRRH